MSDEHLSRPSGHDASGQSGAIRGVLSALWSFLHHPAAALEERLSALEDTASGLEHRLEEDFKRAVRGRVAGIQARLETVKERVIEDLKRELRRVILLMSLVVGCAGLALVGAIFGLTAAWMGLTRFLGSLDASLVLAIAFLVASLMVFAVFRSVLHRSVHPP
jgi:hypothetical protein